jgi:hypothetical protein
VGETPARESGDQDQTKAQALTEQAEASHLSRLVDIGVVLGIPAAVAQITSVFGLAAGIVSLAIAVVLVIGAAVRSEKLKAGAPFWRVMAAGVTLAAIAIALVSFFPLTPSQDPPGNQDTPKRAVIDPPRALNGPGVRLSVEPRNDTLLRYSWEILKPLPSGKVARFLVLKIPNVDRSNPHPEFYAWKEITEVVVGAKNDYSRDTDVAPVGAILFVQIYVVDATCAEELRDNPKQITTLCSQPDAAQPDSDGFKITVEKK